MPLSVAHSLVGASVAAALWRQSQQGKSQVLWKLLAISAFLAVFPDFDYILNWLRIGWGGWHHGFTHSFVFALFAGAVTILVTGWRDLRTFIAFSAATASHGLLDYLITESRGIALFWPFTDYRYKLRIPNPINYTWSTASFWDTAVDVLLISLTELIIFGPLLLFVMLLRIMSIRKGKLLHGMDH
jgi:membrane-bound metal-dependent hydrolase YbcI (DUF457 family)